MKCRHFHKILYEALQRNHRLMHQMYASSLSEYIDLTTRDPHITKGKMHILDGFIPLYTPPSPPKIQNIWSNILPAVQEKAGPFFQGY